jgi:hypothetical protein
MIIVYAGRLPSGDGGEFPDAHLPVVQEQLRALIAALRPRVVIGSAAAGADLLLLAVVREFSEEFSIACRVITAGSRSAFRKVSVDPSGPYWSTQYERAMNDPRTNVTELDVPSDDIGFDAVRHELLRRARRLQRRDEPVIGIDISPGRPRPGLDHTVRFTQSLTLEGRLVLNVRTDLPRFPDAFVAMPFGRKATPRWANYESDLSYLRIFTPALIAAGYQPKRVDNDNLTEIIDAAMIRPLGTVDLVVGDLTSENPNVFWELGVRHAWRPNGTSLVCVDGSVQFFPFDLGRIPVNRYYRSEDSVSDIDLMRSLKSLVPAFAAQHAGVDVDSPVFASIPSLRRTELPRSPNQGRDAEIDLLEQGITTAGALRRAPRLFELSTEISQKPALPDVVKERLLGNIALELVSLGKLDDARELLAPLARADEKLENIVLQQTYAHTLIRGNSARSKSDLYEAARILRALRQDPPDAETSGLLGSAEKVMAERAYSEGDLVLMREHARAAAEAYEVGFLADVRAYYPGVNALALRRLLGQRWEPNKEDVTRAREILPVVRFVAQDSINRKGASIWAQVTIAELNLHEYLLDDPNPAGQPPEVLIRSFSGLGRLVHERRDAREAMVRQLRFMLAAGDPAHLINVLIARIDS